MTKKLMFSFLFLALVFGGVSATGSKIASAQSTPAFPVGCTSALGYSVTNGTPCNGLSTATIMLNGCTTALGYSITNGTPCSGANFAIQYLSGCSSIYGFSTIYGVPCNGTNTASTMFVPDTTPGLPITGAGGNAFVNVILLLSSGLVVLIGSIYLVKKYQLTV